VRSTLFRAFAFACPLLMYAGALDQSPAQMQPPIQDDKGRGGNDRPAEKQQEPPEKPPPSIVDLFKPNGIDRIAAYCEKQPDTRPNDWLHSKFICEIRVTDVAIAWFSLASVVVTFLLIAVGVAQVTIMRFTARRQLRAYVFIESVEFSDIEIGASPTVVIKVKNYGQTPAYDLGQWAAVGLDTFPVPQHPPGPLPNSDLPRRALGNGDVASLHPAPDRVPLNQADMAAIDAAQSAIWVVGEVRYRDVFRKRRYTRFRLFLNSEKRMSGFAAHHEGNKAN
jgi:hypothetical protein